MEGMANQDLNSARKPRLVILGGGAIGSVIAAALAAQPGLEPLLVGRRDHVRAIREHGLRVDGLLDAPVRLAAREAIDFPLDDTLLMVTVKAVDLDAALRGLAPCLRPTTALLLLQNGLRHQGAGPGGAARLARPRRRTCSSASWPWARPSSAPARCAASAATSASSPPSPPRPGSTCCSGLTLKVETSRDIGRDLWTKLLVNAVINPLSVLLQGHNRLVAEERFDALKSPILAEGVAVAAAEGVELEDRRRLRQPLRHLRQHHLHAPGLPPRPADRDRLHQRRHRRAGRKTRHRRRRSTPSWPP